MALVYDWLARWLPLIDTSLIGISGALLLFGFWSIRRRRVARHRLAMLGATTFAALFLVVYVTRAALFPTRFFAGQGLVRGAYLAILIPHTLLAIAVGPLALLTLWRAFHRQFRQHRRVARLTLPIWLYVVVSGWMVYLMLYHLA